MNNKLVHSRLNSIDALRGLVMVIMLIDHIRDIFFGHIVIHDPVDVTSTDISQFTIRLFSSLCAPIFILLTGISAYLYGQKYSKTDVARFLFTRGVVLILLELTVINTAWTGEIPPSKLYLQVIWVIGLSMVTLSLMIFMPKKLQWFIVIIGIGGHNLLDDIVLLPHHDWYNLWAILHQRDWIQVSETLIARTSYPLIPWPSVILLGYLLGHWFTDNFDSSERRNKLIKLGLSLILLFVFIRALNVYGDQPWTSHDSFFVSLMGYLALTKYPPSLLFLLFTIGVGAIILTVIEKYSHKPFVKKLASLGSAPMYFYILHLYCLGVCYLLFKMYFLANYNNKFVFDSIWQLILLFICLIGPLYYATARFGRLKQKRRDIKWLKYL